MIGYRLSPRALADLEDIRNYTVERWGGRRAEAYIRQTYGTVEAPAAMPGSRGYCREHPRRLPDMVL
jgi:plasmid stabilization system protein ParE